MRDYLNSRSDCHYVKSAAKSTESDLECEIHGELIEVKKDRKALTTGNLCFEKNLFSKTRSNKVIYVIGSKAYIFSFDTLWAAIKELNAAGATKYMLLGDGWKNPAILVKAVDILPIAEEITLEEE